MGSSKKHKDSKKRKHRSRSRSVEKREKHRHHKRHHKDRKKEKILREKTEFFQYEEASSEDDVATPPPPKISRLSSPPRVSRTPSPRTPPPPPAPAISSRPTPPAPVISSRTAPPAPVISSRPAPPAPTISSRSDQSLSIEETNKLRARLGLKPLQVDTVPVTTSETNGEKKKVNTEGGVDMGEFVHKPAEHIGQKMKSEKIRERVKEHKEKRSIEQKLSKVKLLADSDSDEDTRAWVQKNRKIQEERLKAEQRAKMLDQLDEEFGIGELVESEMRDDRRTAYNNKHLKGLKVQHNVNEFSEGKTLILTLQDKGVLDEEEDVLVNVNMLDDERYKKNIANKKINVRNHGYDAYDMQGFDEFGNVKKPAVLNKYDEEIEGEKKSSFVIGENPVEEHRQRTMQAVREKLHNKVAVSLDTPSQIASDYFTEQEIEVKFKKTKRKFRKIRKKPLKASDLAPLSPSSNDYGSRSMPSPPTISDHHGSRSNGSSRGHERQELDFQSMRRRIKEEPLDDAVDVDDLLPVPDLSDVKLEPDDDEQLELQLALSRARRVLGDTTAVKPTVEKIAKTIVKGETADGGDAGAGGSIVLNSTAEFCRTLGDIPTYGLAGNRDEDADLLDFERELNDEKKRQEEEGKRGGWNEVEIDETPVDVLPEEVPILDAEPTVGSGIAGALSLAISKGYLEKETTKKPSASRFAHLQAQNYSIEDKTFVDDEKFGRRERYNGPTSDFKEKDCFKPNVKLEYIDDDGHILNAKEAFRYLSHKFHGKGPGKNKVEKRMKKNQQEGLMKQMSSTDTPLNTLSLLQQKQKETQSPFVVLSGSKQATSISKTKL